jgi:hypothetical protein
MATSVLNAKHFHDEATGRRRVNGYWGIFRGFSVI